MNLVEFDFRRDLEGAISAAKAALFQPSSRSDRIRHLLFPAFIVGVSDFLHLNPSNPTREFSGLIRLKWVNEILATHGAGLRLASLVYDNPLPRSEAAREGGGFGMATGIVKRTVPAIADPDACFSHQRACSVDFTPVLDEGSKRVLRWSDAYSVDAVNSFLETRLRWVFDLYNSGEPSNRDAASHIRSFKIAILHRLGIPAMPPWHLATHLRPNIADVLEFLAYEGVPWWEIPRKRQTDPLFRLLDATGKITGVIHPERRGARITTTRYSPFASWNNILNLLRSGQLIPCVQIYLLACVITPNWLHFGNLYGHHEMLVEWYRRYDNSTFRVLRVAADNENSVSLGRTAIQSRGGIIQRALLTIDLLARDSSELESAALRTAITGTAAWPAATLREQIISQLSRC